MEIKSWIRIFRVCMVKSGCGYSGHKNLKLAVYQEGINGINWFFTCWYKLRKIKSSLSNFYLGVVKNGHGLLCCGTRKSSLYSSKTFFMVDRRLKCTFDFTFNHDSFNYKSRKTTCFMRKTALWILHSMDTLIFDTWYWSVSDTENLTEMMKVVRLNSLTPWSFNISPRKLPV